MATHEHEAIPSKAAIGGHPIHPMLVPFPLAFLVGVLVSDLVFWWTGDPFWARGSLWLAGAGLVTGVAAAAAGLTDFIGRHQVRALSAAWIHFIGNAAALLLTLWSVLHRADDPVAGALPLGLVLSVVVAAILGVTGWYGGELSYRHRVGVMPDETGHAAAAARTYTHGASPR
ncbi:MAG TPA: DUF2231 domain-containing protein [Alphaproteobacteria bacterium]